jgi:alpha,alpha-trehalase
MNWTTLLSAVLLGVELVAALPNPQEPPPTLTYSTAVASPSSPTSSFLPPQVPLPPTQPWCRSKIFCPGSVSTPTTSRILKHVIFTVRQLLQTVNVAELYPDQKTFVDKPTNKPPSQVLTDFAAINGSNPTYGQVQQFVDSDFSGEGLELEAVALPNFNSNPSFLGGVKDPLVKAWSAIVHGYWAQLIRSANDSALCNGVACESSLIPLNHTFVVPGGRFREICKSHSSADYLRANLWSVDYWDSFWIIEGLIQSELYGMVNSTLHNFMDQMERFGFIPNGGRIYYLNRSQPPLFTHMLDRYVKATNDTGILKRALPLAERELAWWSKNRTIPITSSYTSKTYNMSHYAVVNSAPRPESYFVDYETATGVNLTERQRSDLYAELASGAESGNILTRPGNFDTNAMS